MFIDTSVFHPFSFSERLIVTTMVQGAVSEFCREEPQRSDYPSRRSVYAIAETNGKRFTKSLFSVSRRSCIPGVTTARARLDLKILLLPEEGRSFDSNIWHRHHLAKTATRNLLANPTLTVLPYEINREK